MSRFRRQLVRASGLDPTVIDSADSTRRGRLAKQGIAPPTLGARRGRPARAPAHQPRPRALHEHRQALRSRPRTTDRRTQDRPPRLPPAHRRSSLSSNRTDVRTHTQAQTIGDSSRRAPSAPGRRRPCPGRGISRRNAQRDLLRRNRARRHRFGPANSHTTDPTTTLDRTGPLHIGTQTQSSCKRPIRPQTGITPASDG
jgi:hypothetical protein